MRDIIVSCIKKRSDNALVTFLLEFSGVSTVATMYGTFFENFALRRLAAGGKFPIKRLKDKDATVLDSSARKTPRGLKDGYLQFPCFEIQRHTSLAAITDAVNAATRSPHTGDTGSSGSPPKPLLLLPESKSFCFVDAFILAPSGAHPYTVFLANATTDATHSIKVRDRRSESESSDDGTAKYEGGLAAVVKKLDANKDVDSDVCMLWLVPPATYDLMEFAAPFRVDDPIKKKIDRIAAMEKHPVCKRVVQYALCIDFSSAGSGV